MAQAEQAQPAVADQPAAGAAQQSPPMEALSTVAAPEPKRGGVLLKLADFMIHGFKATIGEGEQAREFLITHAGRRVSRDEAKAIKEVAAAHGVPLTEEEA